MQSLAVKLQKELSASLRIFGAKADEVRAVAAPPAARPAAPSVVAVPLAAAAGDEGPTQVSVRELGAMVRRERLRHETAHRRRAERRRGGAAAEPPPDGGRRAARVGAVWRRRALAARRAARPAPPAAPDAPTAAGRASPLPDEAVGGAPASPASPSVSSAPSVENPEVVMADGDTFVFDHRGGGGGLWEEPGPARSRSPRGRSVHRTIG